MFIIMILKSYFISQLPGKKEERERERERERENKFKDCQYFYRIHFNLATEPQGDLISRRYDLLAEHQ